MSNFVSDVGKAARRFAGKVGQEISCAALEQRISDGYRELGRLYYEAVQRGDAPEGEDFRLQLGKISELKQELARKKEM